MGLKELVQRLSVLDADASAALKVIAYFDTLLARGAGIEAFLRGAAVLGGCPAGLAHPRHQLWIRVDKHGRSTPAPHEVSAALAWPHHKLEDESGGIVWIERTGELLVHDAMLLERLAGGVHLTIERVSPLSVDDDAAAVEILLSETPTHDARRKALSRLHLTGDAPASVLATQPADLEATPRRSAVLSTSAGMVRASILRAGEAPGCAWYGRGPEVTPRDLGQSWCKALIALRLTSRLQPALEWEQLGSLGPLVASADGLGEVHSDVGLIESAARDSWALDTMEALATSDSSRAAAIQLGLHHSTVQARQLHLEEELGFKVSTSVGRTRLLLALALYRARHARFGPSGTGAT